MPVESLLARLVVAVVLGGLVGAEREYTEHTAGLRTHALVALGAATFTVVSVGFGGSGGDRIAAQVVSGIGFLGAGAILREGLSIRGLTTAAGVWSVAAIGMAAGAGRFALAGLATLLALVVLIGLRIAERHPRVRASPVSIRVESPTAARAVVELLHQRDDVKVQSASTTWSDRGLLVSCILRHRTAAMGGILAAVTALDGVVEVDWLP